MVQNGVSRDEIGDFIDKKANLDEICSDIQNITSNVSKLLKEFKFHKSDQLSFNEAQLRDNCFGRWLWTRSNLVTPGEFLSFDTESANTSPQNLRWWKPNDTK